MRQLLRGSVRFWFVIVSLLFLAPVPGTALAQMSDALRAKAASDAPALLAKAVGQGEVRVIVTLSGSTSGSTGPSSSSSTTEPSAAMTAGPLGDGQVATLQQSELIARHIGADASKRQRWATRIIPGTPYVAMTVNAAELRALASDPNVVRIHEDGIMRPGLQDSTPLVGMPAAFAFGATGANRMVAILDTGVEYGHVFVSPRVTNALCFSTTNASFTTLCPNGQPTQVGGSAGVNCGVAGCNHGTHVAGIAAGSRSSGTPRNGVAKAVSILAVQVFSRRNTDNALTAFDSDILAALNDIRTRVSPGGELASRGLRAINMSIWDGGFQVAGNCDANARATPFKTVIDQLLALNVATVIISGNASQRNLSAFPGCVSTAITVSSTTKTDAVSDFSNVSTIVDLFAPGDSINSSINPTPNFGVLSGTSMAAPHVAGAFAAISSACPEATSGQIETALENTGVLVADGRPSGIWTRPRIRVNLAAKLLCSKNDLLVDFGGSGLWQRMNNTAWLQIHTVSPLFIAAGDLDNNDQDEAIASFPSGLWVRFNNAAPWVKLHNSVPTRFAAANVDGTAGDDLIVDFGAGGIWVRYNNTTWTKLNGGTSQDIETGDLDGNGQSEILIDFGSSGLWVRLNNASWVNLHNTSPVHIAVGDLDGNGLDDAVIDFGSGSGTWIRHNNATWTKLHNGTTQGLAADDFDGNGKDDVLVDFGAAGLWVFNNNSSFAKLNNTSPVNFATSDLDSSGKADAAIDFGGSTDLWVRYNNATWTQLSTLATQAIVGGGFD